MVFHPGERDMTDRVILHVDLNCFYASVEAVLNPALRGAAVAVCGSKEDRHGIVLAKSEVAKRAGVKTGMITAEAQRLCPSLIVVPPRFSMYEKFSRLARNIYLRYSDYVEPFGMDENWIDLTGAMAHYESPFAVAEEIRTTVSRELGLTVSVGVSFNKIFAKLASDMKKPDATTVISRENFREVAWRAPATDLLFVGRSTGKMLTRYSIHTIGDLAKADPRLLTALLGKSGGMLHAFANGLDTARVRRADETTPPKSVGHGITCNADVTEDEEVARIFLELAQDIGRQLRREKLYADGIQIAVKNRLLETKQFDSFLPARTQSARVIAEAAFSLYRRQYRRDSPVRALTVRATRLTDTPQGDQMSLFYDYVRLDRETRLERATDDIIDRYGRGSICPAAVLLNDKTRSHAPEVSVLPPPYFAGMKTD